YKSMLKPVWTYGIQLWGAASHSNIEIIQRFQNKALRCITGSPWYVKNVNVHRDLQMTSVKDVAGQHSRKYKERLTRHPNPLAAGLVLTQNGTHRLKRRLPPDLWNQS